MYTIYRLNGMIPNLHVSRNAHGFIVRSPAPRGSCLRGSANRIKALLLAPFSSKFYGFKEIHMIINSRDIGPLGAEKDRNICDTSYL